MRQTAYQIRTRLRLQDDLQWTRRNIAHLVRQLRQEDPDRVRFWQNPRLNHLLAWEARLARSIRDLQGKGEEAQS